MQQFRKFLFSRGVLIALIMTIVYGFLVFTIYFTGYKPVPKQLIDLPITIVNQDTASRTLAKHLKNNLKFKHIQTTTNLSEAKRDLNQRKVYLVIAIPDHFNTQLKANRRTSLKFYINQSNPTFLTSGMTTVANQVGNQVNQTAVISKGKAILAKSQATKLDQALSAQQAQMTTKLAASEAQIATASAAAQPALKQQLQRAEQAGKAKLATAAQQGQHKIKVGVNRVYRTVPNSVQVAIHELNHVPVGMNHSLAPFMANLAMYLGTLMAAVILYATFANFAAVVGRFKAFAMLEMAMLLLSVIGALAITASINPMLHLSQAQFGQFWVNHALEMMAGFNLNSVFILMFGIAGTPFNVFLNMIQVISGGGLVPVALLNPFYSVAQKILPMYYSIQSDFNILYGGPNTGSLWLGMLFVILGLLVLNAVIVTIKRRPTMVDFTRFS